MSYDKVALRGDASRPSFANFFFDLVGPSYIRPLASLAVEKMQPGFLVADMWLDAELTLRCVQGFVRKTRMIRAQPNSRPFIAFLLADRFASDAFQFGKQQGVVFTTPENIFGTHVAGALAQLITTISDAATAGHADPGAISDLLQNLGRIEGAALNLRGPLFELIVAYVLATLEGGALQVGKTITGAYGKRAEIDVLSAHADRVRACECKGHRPGHVIGVDMVKKWLEERVPVAFVDGAKR